MTLTIALPPDEERKLSERAAASGQDVTEFVHRLIQREIDQRTFAEILAPIHEEVRRSGIQERELNELLESALAESRRERRAKSRE